MDRFFKSPERCALAIIASVSLLTIVLFVLAQAGGVFSAPGAVLLYSFFAAFSIIAAVIYADRRVLEPGRALKDKTQILLEQERSEARRKERAIIENAVDVICVIDEQTRFLSVNQAVEKNWGYSASELLGRPLADFLDMDEKDRSLETVIGAKFSIDKVIFENRFKHKNGSLIDLSWTAHWSAHDGGLFCVARDISQRKQAELRLRESEERNRTTLEAMPVGVVCANLLGQIEFANENWLQMSGMTAAELIGTPVQELFAQDAGRIYTYLVKAAESTSAQPPVETVINRNAASSNVAAAGATSGGASPGDSSTVDSVPGAQASCLPTVEKLEVELSATTFTINSSKKLLVIVSDIRQRKEVERLRQQFVAMVNHDLRTPLASLSGMISMLKRDIYGQLNEKGQEMSRIAEAELERLMRLVSDLLELEKIESGSLKVQKSLVSVQDLLEASAASVKVYADLRKVNIEFCETELACSCDRSRIIQVLINLLSNAIKFSPANSPVEIQVELCAGELKFSVSDKGRGVPEGKEGLLFQRFRQVNPDDAVERAGSGLGLSICRSIVQAHGGTIGYKALSPRGSVFWFTLPHTSAGAD